MDKLKNSLSCRIARRADEQGARPPTRNQAGVEKSITGTTLPNNDLAGNLTETFSQKGPPDTKSLSRSKQKTIRQRWTREEYIQVMTAFYEAKFSPAEGSNTEQTYKLWREKHPEIRPAMDGNKLANVRRDIVKNKRLEDTTLQQIQNDIREKIEIQNVDNSCSATNDGTEESEILHETTVISQPDIETSDQTNTIDSASSEEVSAISEKIMIKLEELKHQHLSDRIQLPKIRKDRKAKDLIHKGNIAILKLKTQTMEPLTITELNQMVYATASVITEELGVTIQRKKGRQHKQPQWKERISKDIECLRKKLSILTEKVKGSMVSHRKITRVLSQLKCKSEADIPSIIEKIKQKIAAKTQRIRRYEKRGKQFRQNKLFKDNAKQFYREIGKKQIDVTEPPIFTEIEGFWSRIWENEKVHNEVAEWIRDQEELYKDQQCQETNDITINEVRTAIKNANNWTSPGLDKIPNFWLKNIDKLHTDLAREYNTILKEPDKCPEWLTQGLTFLIPKSNDTNEAKNYRPITCLPTMYKTLTSIITDRTYLHLEDNRLLPNEKKGCKRGSYGCKDQLLVNKMIMEDCKTRKKNLTTSRIDYRKAFDSVPHSWIIKTLELYKVSPEIVNFMKVNMKNWKTTLLLRHATGTLTSRLIEIRSGIFQGDSLSPLLFCLALAPLSNLLHSTNCGYDIQGKKINHLFCMDDLKVFGRDNQQQERLLKTVKTFSDDINMKFGLEKCVTAELKRGKLATTTSIRLDEETTIKELQQEDSYKYLGINEADGIQHAKMKEKIRKEYYRRVRLILKSELNAVNRIAAINSLAIPVITYSMNILNWKINDLKRLDTKTRKLLTMYRMHHPKADVDRLYLPRSEGGRGLMQIELTFKIVTVGLETYLRESKDEMMKLVLEHEKKKKLYSVTKEATKFCRELEVDQPGHRETDSVTNKAKEVKNIVKKQGKEQIRIRWEQKPLHGQYLKRLKRPDVDETETHKWLKSSGLKSETEGPIIAAQDQSLMTKQYQSEIMKNGMNPKCRLCNQYNETIDHIVSGCPVLAKSEFMQRHDKAASYIHWRISKAFKLPVADKWYNHSPETVVSNDQVTLIWDMQVHTDKEIKANKPDIIIKDHINSTCQLIDMTIPSDRNVSIKEVEKFSNTRI